MVVFRLNSPPPSLPPSPKFPPSPLKTTFLLFYILETLLTSTHIYLLNSSINVNKILRLLRNDSINLKWIVTCFRKKGRRKEISRTVRKSFKYDLSNDLSYIKSKSSQDKEFKKLKLRKVVILKNEYTRNEYFRELNSFIGEKRTSQTSNAAESELVENVC